MSDTITDDAPKKGRRTPAPVDSRRWRWRMRFNHALLFVAPIPPLVGGFFTGGSGSVEVKLNAAQSHAAHIPGIPGHPAYAIVNVHPSWWEGILMGMPGGAVSIGIALTCYAIWRVEINIAAGHHPGYRMFTDKDTRWLKQAASYLASGWIFAAAAELVLPSLLPSASHLEGSISFAPAMPSSFLLMPMAIVLSAMVRVYLHGKAAYDRQADVV
jgi:hypothetical protein